MQRRIDVAIGILHRQGRILICQRAPDQTFPGLWEFPGGKCEAGETPAQAVVRELREELGVEVNAHTPLTPIEHDYPDFAVRLHPFLCRLSRGDQRPVSAQSLKWIKPAQLRSHQFPPANAALLLRLMAGKPA